MAFLSELHLREAPEVGTDHWTLLQHLVYEGKKDRFVVPLGYPTDLASIPAIFQPLGFPKTHTAYNRAAVLHDYLTHTGEVSRKDADGLMGRIAREEGAGVIRSKLMWAGVRLYSGWVWLKGLVTP